ncbi:alkene reductase [Actinosynnema sp. ALI-1.44]|uniref:oxidoreductase n=1 Tax=Actinosynnema sp. ALI-1.44 TaxID=1933779 RepID=UPI00097BEEAF|nr:alkene reductase [Actinosynnema sp. ALI-1.44]ONI76475.1 alkene reductase [Actinosynnema sp. ALI-1.44]
MRTLFDEVELGGLTVPNRIVMSPMGRCRVGRDGVPGPLNAEYYAQRAAAGLIVTEATIPSEAGQGHTNMARIHSADQVAAWREVTDAVHRAGGRIFVQLLHWGRIGHPDLYGHHPVAPSPVRPAGQATTYAGKKDFPVPRELTQAGIDQTVEDFAAAARNAVSAGFDGVELHAANGYLIHQFLSAHTNRRTDGYGGTVSGRIRFAVEVATAVAAETGADRLGIRLSPGGFLNDIQETDFAEVYLRLTRALADVDLAYLHLVTGTDRDLARRIRAGWPNLVVLNPGTGLRPVDETLATAAEYLADGFDLLSFAKQFLANPDLPDRLRLAAGLNAPDPATFYAGGAKGYTDYPALAPSPA